MEYEFGVFDCVVGDVVFMRYMRVPGTVLEVVTHQSIPLGYIVDVEDYGPGLFRADEIEDYEDELWRLQ